MTAGRFFAQMTVVKRGIASWPTFGVVKKDFPEEDKSGPAFESGEGWMFDTDGGVLWCPQSYGLGQAWPGCEGAGANGDRVGLLLDMDKGTIEVYKNDVRMGMMMRPGLAVDEDGAAVTDPADEEQGTVIEPLVGPVRWAVDMAEGAEVRIEWKELPVVTAADLAEDARKAAEYRRAHRG